MRVRSNPYSEFPSRADRARRVLWQVGLLHLLFQQQRITTLRLFLVILAGYWHGITASLVAKTPANGRRRRRRLGHGSGARAGTTTCDNDLAASYARFSSDLQSEESNAQQQAKTRDAAANNGHCIPPELEFSDEAVSGTKRERDGLNSMLEAAEAGAFKTLYLYSLSRLARETVISLPVLKRLVHRHNVRIICLVDGLDTAQSGWEVMAHVISIINEQFLKELSESVLRGQEGALQAGYCIGDYRFGYRSAPVPGSETTRRGRKPRPRMVYVIDAESAEWVVRIFHWFVVERRTITWIVKELNRLGVRKDHRSSTPAWRHAQVVGVLESEKYVGIWPWGEMTNVRDPETGKIRQKARPEEESQQWTRLLPHLRLIDDDEFQEAQRLLEENARTRPTLHDSQGRFRGSKAGQTRPRHLLSGLIVCAECDSRFYVGGTNAKYLFCPQYKRGLCHCQTQLRRDRAERMILDSIGQLILNNRHWLDAVNEAALNAWRRQEEEVPRELLAAERSLDDVQRKIDRLVDRIEDGDDPDVSRRLTERRAEKRQYLEEVDRLRRLNENRRPEPSPEWVREQLGQLSETIHGDSPAAALALRDLVGGQIVVSEIRQEGRQRHRLQGRFTLRSKGIASTLVGTDCKTEDATDMEQNVEIVIDFVDPDPIVEQSERAKELYDQGLMNVAIAETLGCSKSQVTRLLRYWFESRGQTMPDGRTRRSTLARKQTSVPLYQRIAEEAKRLWDENLSVVEIACRLDCSDVTAHKAIAAWHERRGLPVPTARDRRLQIGERARELYEEEGWTIERIATEFGYSPRGMKLLIEQTFIAEGREMPDGRCRRDSAR